MNQFNVNKTTKGNLFDPSLTPCNAQQKGFKYIDDVIYDFINPSEAIIEVLKFCREFHCKLGTPTSTYPNNFFGLYMPLNQIYEKHQRIK